MAAPNVVNVSSIIGKTQGGALATTLGDWVTCLTDKLVKVNVSKRKSRIEFS